MSDLDLSALDIFKGDADILSSPVTHLASIEPVDHKRKILAVDQSIANTGWALIVGKKVTWTGNIKTEKRGTGHEDTLERGSILFWEYDKLLCELTG
ncbi:MAG: hypothetical protein R3330_08515, partial [Saprospiraceae bacterium]|nr:hypothetical protein [Saprospiraceae bacterium]